MGTQLLETIKCLNGELFDLKWHNDRFNQARHEHIGLHTKINLANFIKVPASAKKGLFRCRISYSESINKLEFIPHQYTTINSLKLIEDNEIDYRFKYADRSKLTKLYEKRGDCDDILIVKNDYITDSFTANPIFFDGANWWSPDTPLLAGTKRAKLLSEGKILLTGITKNDLWRYQKVGLINAMWDLENMPVINITNIHN
uniref:hypothetical protein n=1 Tax=uncultured Draconibacterium sp. TaxID=1573823 RepID=UPI00321734F1